MGMVTPQLRQVAGRFRADDGGETASWLAGQNEPVTLAVGVRFRVRLELQEFGGGGYDIQPLIRTRHNGGSWVSPFAGDSGVVVATSPHYSNLDATTNQLTAGTGSFVAGRMLNNSNGFDGGTITVPANGHTEYEWCLQLNSAVVSDGDTVEFRVYNPIDDYAHTPALTVGTGTPPAPSGSFDLSARDLAGWAGDRPATSGVDVAARDVAIWSGSHSSFGGWDGVDRISVGWTGGAPPVPPAVGSFDLADRCGIAWHGDRPAIGSFEAASTDSVAWNGAHTSTGGLEVVDRVVLSWVGQADEVAPAVGAFDLTDRTSLGWAGTRPSTTSLDVVTTDTVAWSGTRTSTGDLDVTDRIVVLWAAASGTSTGIFPAADRSDVTWEGDRPAAGAYNFTDLAGMTWTGRLGDRNIDVVYGAPTGRVLSASVRSNGLSLSKLILVQRAVGAPESRAAGAGTPYVVALSGGKPRVRGYAGGEAKVRVSVGQPRT